MYSYILRNQDMISNRFFRLNPFNVVFYQSVHVLLLLLSEWSSVSRSVKINFRFNVHNTSQQFCASWQMFTFWKSLHVNLSIVLDLFVNIEFYFDKCRKFIVEKLRSVFGHFIFGSLIISSFSAKSGSFW